MELINFIKNNYIIYIVGINIISFFIFSIDKYRANNRKYRIRELFFYLISLLGGSTGIIFGIIILKHKISKNSFSYKILILFLLNRILEYNYILT